MKLCGLMIVGPDEPYLARAWDDFDRLKLDSVTVVLNHAPSAIEQDAVRRGYRVVSDNRDWGKFQAQIKQDALSSLAQLSPDWILMKDADEVFEPKVTRSTFHTLAEAKDFDGFSFLIVSLWNNEQTVNPKLCWWLPRFFRYPADCRYTAKPAHCDMVPTAIQKVQRVPFAVLHFGYMTKDRRKGKIERYKVLDPDRSNGGADFYKALESPEEGQGITTFRRL